MAKKTLSIDERLALLWEAEQFFADLSDAGETSEKLWRLKAAALGTVKQCLELYQQKMLGGNEWEEDDVKEALELAIKEEFIERAISSRWMTDDEAAFYKGWFGLAIWIMEWDKESIDWLRKLQAEYDEIVDMKLANKTIWDLIK